MNGAIVSQLSKCLKFEAVCFFLGGGGGGSIKLIKWFEFEQRDIT